jgi:hypothetical protein
MYLRQSTASQEIVLGRFVDSGDANTEETSLTIANTDIKLFKAGATTLASKNSGGATHIASGMYSAVLDATDTDTVGELEVHVHVSGALSVQRRFFVLEEAVFDALFAASATGMLPANVTHFGGSAGTFASGRPEVNATHWGGTAVGSANVRANIVQVAGQTASAAAGVTFPASIGTSTVTTAQVNAEILDVLATDTFAEPSSVPAATSSLKDKINWLFALARNKITQTSTTQSLRNDADSGNIGTAGVADDGSTFSRNEWS